MPSQYKPNTLFRKSAVFLIHTLLCQPSPTFHSPVSFHFSYEYILFLMNVPSPGHRPHSSDFFLPPPSGLHSACISVSSAFSPAVKNTRYVHGTLVFRVRVDFVSPPKTGKNALPHYNPPPPHRLPPTELRGLLYLLHSALSRGYFLFFSETFFC